MSVLLLRHVHAGDRAAWRGDERQRPASPRGHAQAAALPAHLAPVLGVRPLVGVWSSPYRRCLDSVGALATAADLAVETVDELAEGTPPDLVDRLLRRAARTADAAGGGVVLCSHGDVIGDAVTGWQRRGWLDDLEPRWPKAGTWVLDDLLTGTPRVRFVPPPTR